MGSPSGSKDPCPCGSGLEYKHCHGLPGRRGAGQTLSGYLPEEVQEEAREASIWQADLVAVPAVISGKEWSRMAVALVVAGDLAVSSDPQLVTTAEPEELGGISPNQAQGLINTDGPGVTILTVRGLEDLASGEYRPPGAASTLLNHPGAA